MSLELTATTTPGEHLVALAEHLAAEIAPQAAAHDCAGSFPFDSFGLLRASGYFLAPVPAELGGLGVTSVHDVVVASSRLARGDAALAIGVNMHLAFVLNVARRWLAARGAGDAGRARAFGDTLERIVADGTVFAAATSEPAQDLTRPATTAARDGDGWLVSGRKVFCTMSPAADVLYAAVSYVDERGDERYGYVLVPRDSPGLVLHDDWDALGMRGSGSNSVTFDDVRVPHAALLGGFAAGDAVAYMDRTLNAGLLHAAAALGVAEAADTHATAPLARRDAVDPRTLMLAADNVVDLAAARALLSRAAALVDRELATPSRDIVVALFAEVQSAKAFVGEAAVRIVDRALALSGGAGYLNGSPLARAYRDVRATPFMHPLGANRAYAFLGELAAGRTPALH
jgi:alkylation response protein AidB-like acyl-CoA dehydrogenase